MLERGQEKQYVLYSAKVDCVSQVPDVLMAEREKFVSVFAQNL